MWLKQNKTKRYADGSYSWWALQAQAGADIEWEIADNGQYTGQVKVNGYMMGKEQARQLLISLQKEI